MVEQFFPPAAQPLARMVYGKRAASSLYALAQTLRRRADHMGELSEAEAALIAESADASDESEIDEAKVINAGSTSTRAERTAIKELVARIDATVTDSDWVPSKWQCFIDECMGKHGIRPGSDEQVVVFTEYADTAEWIADRLINEGFTAKVYSGRQTKQDRDEIRKAFMRGEFQAIVTTDAGNEGIDLQAAHVLVNYDIPWSLVRLSAPLKPRSPRSRCA